MNITQSEIICATHGCNDPQVEIVYLSKIKRHLETIPDTHARGTWQHEAYRKIACAVLTREIDALQIAEPVRYQQAA